MSKKVWLQKVQAEYYIPYNAKQSKEDNEKLARKVFEMKSNDIDFFNISVKETIESRILVDEGEE
tara:strand:+ start:429 stop:623 length:195 start_codon:yes stop_codon:yes gene_type:complete